MLEGKEIPIALTGRSRLLIITAIAITVGSFIINAVFGSILIFSYILGGIALLILIALIISLLIDLIDTPRFNRDAYLRMRKSMMKMPAVTEPEGMRYFTVVSSRTIILWIIYIVMVFTRPIVALIFVFLFTENAGILSFISSLIYLGLYLSIPLSLYLDYRDSPEIDSRVLRLIKAKMICSWCGHPTLPHYHAMWCERCYRYM